MNDANLIIFSLGAVIFLFSAVYSLYSQAYDRKNPPYVRPRHLTFEGYKEKQALLARIEETSEFTALTTCPKCLTADVHYVKAGKKTHCTRQCKSCDFNWSQR